MITVALAGLVQIDLPDRTVRLSDGGVVRWGSEIYAARDSVYGVISEVEELTEGVGDEVPSLGITYLPAASAAPADLARDGDQASRVRLWIAELNMATGAVIGTPDLQFDGQLDQAVLTVGRDRRDLTTTVVSTAERLFARNEGNSLSPAFHALLWPGEAGQDLATGLTTPVAWGATATGTDTTEISRALMKQWKTDPRYAL
ncbi:UNVERIFIED_ORG: hypothetical protein M2348_001063 [Sphingomonas sp. R1F5B]